MSTSPRRNSPSSPCDNTCVLDRLAGLCVGCLRTLEEIGTWDRLTADQKWDVLRAIEERRAERGKQ